MAGRVVAGLTFEERVRRGRILLTGGHAPGYTQRRKNNGQFDVGDGAQKAQSPEERKAAAAKARAQKAAATRARKKAEAAQAKAKAEADKTVEEMHARTREGRAASKGEESPWDAAQHERDNAKTITDARRLARQNGARLPSTRAVMPTAEQKAQIEERIETHLRSGMRIIEADQRATNEVMGPVRAAREREHAAAMRDLAAKAETPADSAVYRRAADVHEQLAARADAESGRDSGVFKAQHEALTAEYERLAAKFVTDIHGENRRQTYRAATDLHKRVYDLQRGAESRMHEAMDREDAAKTPEETRKAGEDFSKAKAERDQASALWSTVQDLGAAARNNPETTERWLTAYRARGEAEKASAKAKAEADQTVEEMHARTREGAKASKGGEQERSIHDVLGERAQRAAQEREAKQEQMRRASNAPELETIRNLAQAEEEARAARYDLDLKGGQASREALREAYAKENAAHEAYVKAGEAFKAKYGIGHVQVPAYFSTHSKTAETTAKATKGTRAAKGAKAEAKATGKGKADDYLHEKVNYGGIETTRGEMIADLQRSGLSPREVDRYLQGQELGMRIRGERSTPEGVVRDGETKAPTAEGERLVTGRREMSPADAAEVNKAKSATQLRALRAKTEADIAKHEDIGQYLVSGGKDNWTREYIERANSKVDAINAKIGKLQAQYKKQGMLITYEGKTGRSPNQFHNFEVVHPGGNGDISHHSVRVSEVSGVTEAKQRVLDKLGYTDMAKGKGGKVKASESGGGQVDRRRAEAVRRGQILLLAEARATTRRGMTRRGMSTRGMVRGWRDVDLRGVRVVLDERGGVAVAERTLPASPVENMASQQPEGMTGTDGRPRSWIMFAPLGHFEHPRYGKLNFTRAKLQEMKRHFDQHTRKIDLALDKDHDQGAATGWVERMELRDGGNGEQPGLYAQVRWTPHGQQLLRDEIYRYFSPEFGPWEDPATGAQHENVPMGGALTNRPFLKVLPPVSLSEGARRPVRRQVSTRRWATVDKATLPRSCFLDPGEADHPSTWRLPIYEGAGPMVAGRYTRRGALNIHAVRAALAAVGGARSGKPMVGLPAGTTVKLERLLQRYGTSGKTDD